MGKNLLKASINLRSLVLSGADRKILIILILTIGIQKIGKCSDIASWWKKTPYNNEICNEDWGNKLLLDSFPSSI